MMDIYTMEGLEIELDNDGIEWDEAGFMIGYIEA